MVKQTVSHSHKPRAISVRLDHDLESNVTRWLFQNPGIHLSRLANLAVRRFISEPQTLQPVQLETAKVGAIKRSIKKMMEQHDDMLDKLK